MLKSSCSEALLEELFPVAFQDDFNAATCVHTFVV
jgi:hypothetical protein